MTVQANLPPTNTNSDGTTSTFNYGFKVTREEHLKATYTVIATGETGDLEIDSVTGVGNDGGGTVSFATAPADGMIVTVDSIAPLSQIEAFTGNKLPPATVERMGDAIAIQNQRQQSQIERSVRFPASDEQIPTLPAKAQRADKILGFTADGSDFLMVEGAAASQAFVDQAEAQADRAVAAATYPYTSGEQKTGAFMPGTGESLTLFTYNSGSAAAVTLPALSGLAAGYNIGICRTAGSGDLTISADDGALINGAASIVLASDYLCLDFTINEAGDEWVAVDKALIGLPVGKSANNIVALDSSAKLPAVDGSQLIRVKDSTARDTAIIAYIKSDMATGDPAGVYGKIISDSFASDSLDVTTNSAYNVAEDYYTNTGTPTLIASGTGTIITTGSTVSWVNNSAWDDQAGYSAWDSGSASYASTGGTRGCLGKDYGAGNEKEIVKAEFKSSTDQGFWYGTNENIVLAVDYSDDGSAWTEAASATTLSGQDSHTETLVWETVGAHRYWRLRIDINNTANNIILSDGIFYTRSAATDMVLRPEATALETSDPSDIAVYFVVEDVDAVIEGADRIIKVSIDNGATWAVCDITVIGAWGSEDTLIRAEGDVSSQTGSNFIWELATENSKEQRIKQVVSVPSY